MGRCSGVRNTEVFLLLFCWFYNNSNTILIFSDCKLQNAESTDLDTQFVSNWVQGETKMQQPNTSQKIHALYLWQLIETQFLVKLQ